MSKIQEALNKIQGARFPKANVDPGGSPVAGVVERPGEHEAKSTAGTSRRVVEFDFDALRSAGLLAPVGDEQALAAEYRDIKRPLVAHALGKRATKTPEGHLVMVTSALPGEGKTFSCINLSLSMAREADTSVILVDADLAKPHITRLFGMEHELGLLDLLDGTVSDAESVILDTNIPGLRLLPAGAQRPNATELLASNRMEKIVSALGSGNRHRIILFDSPPLLLTSEAKVLASLVGQIALIVKAGETPQQAVLEAIHALPEEKATNLVLNQARPGGRGGYYGYGQYGYGSYGHYGDTTGGKARSQ